MKKLRFLVLLLAFASITSCTDDNKEATPVIAVKSIISSYEYTREFEYKGNKLTQKKSEGYFNKYFYTGSFLTRIEFFDKEVKTGYVQLEYKGSSLTKFYRFDINTETAFRTDVFNSSNHFTLKTYSGDYYEQDDLKYIQEYQVNGGNVTKIIGNDGSYVEYSYDTKNNPFVNILGIKELQLIFGPDYGVNNYVSRYHVNASTGDVYPKYMFEYIYDSNNFPVKMTEVYPGGYEGSSVEFNY